MKPYKVELSITIVLSKLLDDTLLALLAGVPVHEGAFAGAGHTGSHPEHLGAACMAKSRCSVLLLTTQQYAS